ncbi:MAG: hypothetical protein JWN30_470 [Bacilli bacterium]|nr:hypothetical protein [Bacilli bacterium]
MWSKLIIWVSIFVSMGCAYLFFFPSQFSDLNKRFGDISNIVALLSMFYAAAALLIESMAYRTVLLSAKLNIKIRP